MADKNPFTRAIQASKKDTELKQPENEAGRTRRDPEEVVEESENADQQAGSEFGLGATGFVSARDRVSADVDDSSGDPAPEIEDAPADRIADGKLPDFHIDGASTNDALSAASGADNTDVGDLTGFDPRSFVEDSKADRNPLNDPQIAASMAFVDDASDSTTDRLSVAAEPGEVAAGAGMAGAAAGLATAAVGAAVGAGGVAFAGVGIVVGSGGVVAGAITTAANEATGGAVGDAVMKNIAGVPVIGPVARLAADAANTVGEIAVAASDVAAGAATPSEAVAGVVSATSGAGSTGAAGSTKGGGAKLVDPDSDTGKPSDAETAFVQATKDALGIRRIPGDIDPGEGDGTQSTGPVNEAIADGIVSRKTNESLVGNPGGPGRRDAPGSSIDQVGPGLGGPKQGSDIDPVEGSAFTGRTRTEGPEDVDFGVGNEPLVGFSDDDEDEDEESDDSDDADDEGDSAG